MRHEAEPRPARSGTDPAPSGERGVALVAAMLVLLFLALIGTGMLVSVNTETKLAGTGMRSDQALNTAEAGIQEALERIRTGDVPNSIDPLMVSQIFLCAPGDVPAVGADTTAMATWQPPGTWLPYTTATKSRDVLTVRYKTNAARTRVYRYDTTRNPAIQTTSGQPIYVIESTGYHGNAHRKVITEVVPHPVRPNSKGAVVSGFQLQVHSNAYLCGYNHRGDTPTWTGMTGRDGSINSCNVNLAMDRWEYDVSAEDRLAGWAAHNLAPAKGAQYGPSPSTVKFQGSSSFYQGAWEALGMSQSKFKQTLGTPQSLGTLSGDFYGNRFIQPPLGTLNVNGGNGEGLLYVDGNVRFKGTVTYRGLIYATGDIYIDGTFWLLGSIIAKGHLKIYSKDDGCTILFSKEAIESNVSRYIGEFLTLSWREN